MKSLDHLPDGTQVAVSHNGIPIGVAEVLPVGNDRRRPLAVVNFASVYIGRARTLDDARRLLVRHERERRRKEAEARALARQREEQLAWRGLK